MTGFFPATTKADGNPTVLRSAFDSTPDDIEAAIRTCIRFDAVDVLPMLGVQL